ncbi:hypothetical protein J3E74DRAFT_288303 [Bipolaris maydis]|nr:hypothetical protein J3E74DRAFT_288303 [Bipolaris maydis]
MLSPTSSAKKPKINGKDLAENDILFYSKVHDPNKLRQCVQPICQLITRRRTKIPCNIRYKLQQELKNFHDLDENQYRIMTNTESFDSSVNGWDLQPNDEDFDTSPPVMNPFGKADAVNLGVLKELESCFDISQKFVKLHKRQENERDWQNVLQEHIFTAYQSEDGGSDPFNNMLLRWERQQEVAWTEFKQPSPSGFQDGKSTLTCPIPDFAYGFPIIDINDPVHKPYLMHQWTENFSLQTLNKLRNDMGILSSPRRALGQWDSSKLTGDKMRGLDLMCFPWAVVEVKSAGVDAGIERTCYCQAANASAAALRLRERLLLASKKKQPNREALVIFAFTCVEEESGYAMYMGNLIGNFVGCLCPTHGA